MKHNHLLPAVLLAAAGLFSGCMSTHAPQMDQRSFCALDTVITLTCYGPNSSEAIDQIQDALTDMEAGLSRTIASSDVSRLNQAHGEPVPAGPELIGLLNSAKWCADITDGYFDVTIAPAADLWGFTKSSHQVPSPDEIAAVLPYVGTEHIHTGPEEARLDDGTQIDLGGIAKGYALEKILDICREQNLTSALIDLGGDLLAYGEHPEHRPWHVGLEDPRHTENEPLSLGTLDLENIFLLTSGDYERFFTSGGKNYTHIIDPFTGCPAESDLHSVTVAAPLEDGSGILSDALATALYVMGRDRAIEYWRSSAIPFGMILVDDEDVLSITPGLEQDFVLLKPEQYTCRVLR